jgi:adenylate kinase family enzyme
MQTTGISVCEKGGSAELRNCRSSCFSNCSDQSRTIQAMKRVAIFGRPGSGKSVFAKSLSKALDVPLYHLDCYYFAANWAVRDKAKFLAWQQKMVDQNRWILDGNNLDSLEMRYARADVAIYFNISKWLCYWRVFNRRVSSREGTSDRPANCPEEIAWILLTYMWKYERMITGHLHCLQEKYPHVHLFEIRRDADLQAVSRLVVQPDKCDRAEE